MTPLAEYTREWFLKAHNDIKSANILQKAKLYAEAAFHSQQAAEKAVKGYLTFHDQSFEKSHDVEEHLESAARIDPSFLLWKPAGKFLTPFAVQSRYPGEIGKVDLQVCVSAYKYAKEILEHTISLLPREITRYPAKTKGNKSRKQSLLSRKKRK